MTLPAIDAGRRLPQGVLDVSPHLAELIMLMATLRSARRAMPSLAAH